MNMSVKGPRILLVEDHPDDELLALHALRKNHITNVAVAHDAPAALTYLFEDSEYCVVCRSYLPDLILLDLRMPKMDGFEFLEKLRSNYVTMNVPVIVLSSSQYRIDIERCQKLGVVDFFSKPLTQDKVKTLKKFLQID